MHVDTKIGVYITKYSKVVNGVSPCYAEFKQLIITDHYALKSRDIRLYSKPGID
jgi:hypothetical protein